ncbi:hypothetical protein VCRA2110O2_30168 [Vibrio crassostreae]|nr:hypothetical protein VCHA44O286_50207 [Vibrio chagasii]CAK2856712.1 hypothetical protein VCRA2110O2_30168 [Vibrio crassostreae]
MVSSRAKRAFLRRREDRRLRYAAVCLGLEEVKVVLVVVDIVTSTVGLKMRGHYPYWERKISHMGWLFCLKGSSGY